MGLVNFFKKETETLSPHSEKEMKRSLLMFVYKNDGYYSEKDMDNFMSKCKLATVSGICCRCSDNYNYYVCPSEKYREDKSKVSDGYYLCVCSKCFAVTSFHINTLVKITYM